MAAENTSAVSPLRRWLSGTLLAALAALAYLPSLRNGFVWDDDTFLTGNSLIRAADGLRRFWFTTQPTDYWPMTSTSLWLEWRLWGTHAMGYHATNLALHIVECLLIWAVLRRLRIPGAWLGALLFAVHPVNVESVAWITQRKNLMAMLFFLPAILFFLRTEPETPAPPGKLWKPGAGRWILLSLIAFTLAMLSKGSVVILPVVLLGIVLWHRRPNRSDFVVLAPFCAVAAILAAVNVWFQTHGTGEIIRHASKLDRLLGAAAALLFYLSKAIWPHPLIFVYPQWTIRAGELRWWLPLAAVAAFTLLLWSLRRKGTRPALFAWGYFALALAPALGFTDIYFMKYSLVADHYQHLALIGITALAGFGWRSLFDRLQGTLRAAWIGLAAGVVLFFAALTVHQGRIYRDVFTLYRETLAHNPDSWLIQNNLGNALLNAGRATDALPHYERSLQSQPSLPEAHNNYGAALAAIGRIDEAMAQYREAIRLDPNYAEAHANLADALRTQKRFAEAVAEYEQVLRCREASTGTSRLKSLHWSTAEIHANLSLSLARLGKPAEALDEAVTAARLDPRSFKAFYSEGNALADLKRYPEAAACYEASLGLKPDNAEAHYNLANTLSRLGRLPEAVDHYEAALRVQPGYVNALNNEGLALIRLGRPAEAAERYRAALQSQPDSFEAEYNLGNALGLLGRPEEAASCFASALRLRPGSAPAHNNLGSALFQCGRPEAAISQYRAAVRLQPDWAGAHENLGSALQVAGRLPEAISEYRTALRLQSDSASAQAKLQRALDLAGSLGKP